MYSVFSEDGHFLVLLFPSSPTHPICLQAKVNLFARVINYKQYSGRAREVAMTSTVAAVN